MRLGIFSTHPIQYQVPLWRRLDKNPDLEIQVFYFSDQGVSESVDPGFNHVVTWDLPLLDGYQYEFLSKRPIIEAKAFCISSIDEFMESHQFDVILLHGYTHKFARQIIRRKRHHGYRVILRAEFTEMPRSTFRWKKLPRKAYLNWFYKHVDHFCPIGKDAIDHLKYFGIEETKMTLSPYSVDDELFERLSKNLLKLACRGRLGIEKHDKVFLFSGKLIPRKQPLLFAEAILKLCKQYPELTVIFLGSGPQYENLKQLLEPELGLKFHAPGFVNQSALGPYFKAADVFVLPSKYDTWGLVVNEAMHFGLPCIVSDMVGSRHDLIIPGETGLVFDHGSADELASCIRHFLDKAELSVLMGEKAHKHIQNYTIEKTVNGIEAAIHKVS